jgi:uncharacterized heparinase superfamily protein
MLLTESGLIFRGVRPLLRLGHSAKNFGIGELLPELALARMGMTSAPGRLRHVPPDAWPGDAQRGRDMVAGAFSFAGQSIERENLSWQPDGALPEWIAALHGFEWLRDLRSAGGERARRMAREMVSLWIGQYPKYNEMTWRADIMGARLASWIAFHDFFCSTADESFRKSYFTSLTRQARHLAKSLPGKLTGLPLMKALRGLAYSGLALEDGDERLEQAFNLINAQIEEQILADGAHISRSPRNTFEFLQCLVDLRTALIAAKIELPEEIQHAIDRITPAVKFFRHGDGGLAQFNGGQEGNAHLCEVTLMHSGARGKANKSLPQCGYERIIQGRSSLIMDTGVPLQSNYSDRAHAGPLSFEYSYGRDRVFVNCGTSEVAGQWRRVLRSTLAHSAVTLDNKNSCQFDEEGLLTSRPTVRAKRHEDDAVAVLQGMHDGYAKQFGLTYRRSVCLQAQGETLRGEERLTGRAGVPFAVRFHLHPDIQAAMEDGKIMLRSRSGIWWQFSTAQGTLLLEESIYVSTDENPVPTRQIVITGETQEQQTILEWDISRQRL